MSGVVSTVARRGRVGVAAALAAVVLTGLILGGCGRAHEIHRARRVKVVLLPEYSLHLMNQKYGPLLDYLSQETGYRLEQARATSYVTFLSAAGAGGADISFQNGLYYVVLAKTRGARPIAEVLTADLRPSSRGAIIVRSDSSIRSPSDLKGKTIAVPSKGAVLGYVAQAMMLRGEPYHLVEGRDYSVVTSGPHDIAIINLWKKKVDAAFVKEAALSPATLPVPPEDIRVLEYTSHFPNWCFAAFPESDPEVVSKISDALLRLDPENPAHQEVLSAARIGGFVETSDHEYDTMRRVVKILGLPF